MFRQDLGNVTRHGIRSSGTDFPVDSSELLLRQTDGDLRPGHTRIIPLVSKYHKLAPPQPQRSFRPDEPPRPRRHSETDVNLPRCENLQTVYTEFAARSRLVFTHSERVTLLVRGSLSPRSRPPLPQASYESATMHPEPDKPNPLGRDTTKSIRPPRFVNASD